MSNSLQLCRVNEVLTLWDMRSIIKSNAMKAWRSLNYFLNSIDIERTELLLVITILRIIWLNNGSEFAQWHYFNFQLLFYSVYYLLNINVIFIIRSTIKLRLHLNYAIYMPNFRQTYSYYQLYVWSQPRNHWGVGNEC